MSVVPTGSNNLATSSNYGWTWIFNALKTGGVITSMNDATDTAIQAQKAAFTQSSIVVYILNFLATFNSTISVPDLNQAGFQASITSPAPGMLTEVIQNFSVTGPAATMSFRSTNMYIWKVVLLVFQVIEGAHYVPKDAEFNAAWSYFKSLSVSYNIADIYYYVNAYLKSSVTNPVDYAYFLTDTRSVTFNPLLDTQTNVYITAYQGFDYMMDPSCPAFTVTRRITVSGNVTTSAFSLKMRIAAYSDNSNISVSNFGYLKNATPSQCVLHAAYRDQLIGSVITVEASDYVAQGTASNQGSDISNVEFVHVAFVPNVNNYLTLGFVVTAVETVQIVGNTLLLVLTVVDSQTRNNSPTLQQTLSYADPYIAPANASTPTVVVACWDPSLEMTMTTVMTDVYTRPV